VDDARPGEAKPRVLYTVPNGSNPTGGSLSTSRRAAIYATARRHRLLILEDDPYYYLQFAPR
jgi:DNA-binding transcriptional MocR family regulator